MIYTILSFIKAILQNLFCLKNIKESDLITVYRIEHSYDKKGIFTSIYSPLTSLYKLNNIHVTEVIEKHENKYNSLVYDFKDLKGNIKDYISCYESLNDFEDCFTSEGIICFVVFNNFEIYEIKIKKYKKRNNNIIFEPKDIISKKDITKRCALEFKIIL